MPEDTEELALNLNGFKKKLMDLDFKEAMISTGVSEVVIARILNRFSQFVPQWLESIDSSFIRDNQKEQYKALIQKRIAAIHTI